MEIKEEAETCRLTEKAIRLYENRRLVSPFSTSSPDFIYEVLISKLFS